MRTVQTALFKQALRACLNNRWQSHFWSFVESFFMFSLLAATYLWDPYRTRYPLTRSLLALSKAGAQGISIAVIIHSYNICTDKIERNGSHLW